MKKKILNWILAFFGLLGVAIVFAGVIIAHGDYRLGVVAAISGLILLFLVMLANYLFGCRPPPLDRKWQKAKTII